MSRGATGGHEALARRLEREVRPLLRVDECHGGYDCCGCSITDAILDHCIRIVAGD